MTACAAVTSIPLAALRRAKRAGCPAFDQASRVHLGPLLAWLFAEDENDSADWHQRWKRAQALGMEHRVAQERGELVDAAQVSEAIVGMAGDLKSQIFTFIENAPPNFAATNGDIAACRVVLRDLLWEFANRYREAGIERFTKINCHTEGALKKILSPE